MLTYEKYIKSVLGKKIDYDKVYGVQCVDFIDDYITKCLGLKIGYYGNAKTWLLKFNSSAWLKNNFTKITPNFKKPNLKQGDIGVRTSGKNGHIFIVDKVVDGYIYYYDQNGNGKGEGVTLRKKPYKSNIISGVLRPDEIKHDIKQKFSVDFKNNKLTIKYYENNKLTYGRTYDIKLLNGVTLRD